VNIARTDDQPATILVYAYATHNNPIAVSELQQTTHRGHEVLQIGIFARTFNEPELSDNLDAIVGHNIQLVQFNLKIAGVDTLPDGIDDELCSRVRMAFLQRRLTMTALSCTYNIIEPNFTRRDIMKGRACQLIERAQDFGTSVLTLCTGTCHPKNMWKSHPDNDTRQSWRAMLDALETLVTSAEANDVVLGIEPEKSNVINSAAKARRCLNEIQSKHLKIVLDWANLLSPDTLPNKQDILKDAIEQLGPDIIIMHAKDIAKDSELRFQAAGKGQLDWMLYFNEMQTIGFDGPVLMHDLLASEVSRSLEFLRWLAAH